MDWRRHRTSLVAWLMVAGAGCSENSDEHSNEDAQTSLPREAGGDVGDATVDSTARDGTDDGSQVMALPSTACGLNDNKRYAVATTTAGELLLGSAKRTFRVHVPPQYEAEKPLPLVLMFHGGGGSGRQLELSSSGMNEIADREGFIAAYPDGTGLVKTWNGGGCCGAAVRDNVDDVGFVAALLDHLEETLCLDRRRVFAAGMSNGAMMSHRLGCELADRIAAIAPVAGTDMTSSCTPTRPVPILHIHGSADGHVPWQGGLGCGPAGVPFTGVEESITRWAMRDQCSGVSRPYFEQGDGSCQAYGDCSDGAEVVLCTIRDGGHSWPGGAPNVDAVDCPGNGAQSKTFAASEVIWRFFAQHPHRP